MSEQTAAAGLTGPEVVELPNHGDAAFGALMDALAPEPEGAPAGEAVGDAGAAGAAAPAGGADTGNGGVGAAGQAGGAAADTGAGAAEPAPAAGGEQAPGPDGAAGGDPADAAATAGGGDLPAAWTASAADLDAPLGELSTKLEETVSNAYQQQAFAAVREEHGQYFEALEKHPRLLVGQQVPAIGKEGMETLRDTNDAKEWQEAVKSLLVAEIRDRAGRDMEENSDFLATVHSSIDLFKNNVDLRPGTKEFDRELADRFVKLAQPYELRIDGKLHGYSIPVQPIIENLRTQVTAERAAKKAAAPAPTPATPPGGAGAAAPPTGQAKPEDRPQAGIPSKAGTGEEREDFSTLFGTIGLPGLRI